MPKVNGKKVSSMEEWAEDEAKRKLTENGVKYFFKHEAINTEIENALRVYPSKDGNNGGNVVDIKCFIDIPNRQIPVMIEAKGKKGDLIKESNGVVEMTDKKGVLSKAVKSKAVNGAIHYANAIITGTESYKEVIAIGINGYKDDLGKEIFEVMAYYVADKNLGIPKLIGTYTDLSFMYKNNWVSLVKEIDELDISDVEREQLVRRFESDFETHLKGINQKMRDDLNISVSFRVQLLCGCIMAGMGAEGIRALKSSDLTAQIDSSDEDNPTDNEKVLRKVRSFLGKKNLPKEKINIVINNLSAAFNNEDFYKPIINDDGVNTHESKIKLVFQEVEKYILPMFTGDLKSTLRLDLTGKLFDVINDWVDVPDNEKNDVVLTPRNVTDLMAKLCRVNCDSYVWDYATGTAGFLVSSMKYMLQDAEEKYKGSIKDLELKKLSIRSEQLLGIEVRPDMYVLAVLNMILMGDGSTNILNKNSLTDFNGNYEQGNHKDAPFPANVFLLNPPYSYPGKGLIFVEKAFSKMKNGYGAILIQENAGSGAGNSGGSGNYAKNILKNNTLLASIRMADIFCGKAGVQTAIYLFEVGKPHDKDGYVKFVDFSNDGYARSNRKKASSEVNFKNVDHAVERHQEVLDFVLNRKKVDDLVYFSQEEFFEDKISLEGNDWTVNQHKKYDMTPTVEDFKEVISNYLSWKVSSVLRGENNE